MRVEPQEWDKVPLGEEARELALSFHHVRIQEVCNSEKGSHQSPTVLAPRSGTYSLQTCEK